MSIKALDTAELTTGKAHDIWNEGFRAIGAYLRSDRFTPDMCDGWHSVGGKFFSIWEKGNPTHSGYFTSEQGQHDATAAVAFASEIGQPPQTQIFFCVDYEASSQDMDAILAYFKAVHPIVRNAGYLSSIYGSTPVIDMLVDAGYAHGGYLTQSTGWQGYDPNDTRLSIVQGPGATVQGLSVDQDAVLVSDTVLW